MTRRPHPPSAPGAAGVPDPAGPEASGAGSAGGAGTERFTAAQRRAERRVAVAFGLSALASLGLVATYIAGGQTQIEGALLAVAFAAFGVGIAIWGEKLLDAREVVESRHLMASEPAERHSLAAALSEEAGPAIRRRSFLVRALLLAGGALTAALIPPVISLGPAPGDALKTTSWRQGRRLVRQDTGEPVRAADLVTDQILTVLPEGHTDHHEAADSVALLIALDPDLVRLEDDKLAGTVDGLVCYSKLCTHAGCPVGLYRAANHSLFCPCHQSQFDVLDDCKPTFGPAARPLPQLPIEEGDDGYLVAKDDFFEPPGPAFWDMKRT